MPEHGPSDHDPAVHDPAVHDPSGSADDDSPAQLSRADWRIIGTRTVHEYRINQVHDIAAALTFYVLLTIFPALLAVLALLGIFGSAEAVVADALRVLEELGGASVVEVLREPLDQLLNASHAGLAFGSGLVATLWAASGFVGTFGRGMNRIYRVEEGRPFWEMRPAMLAVSAVLVVLGAIAAAGLVMTGPVAEAAARVLGLDEGVVFWWDLAKVPVLAAIGVLVLAVLYWAAPNVRRRHLRWFSIGAVAALLAWIATTALFALYVFGVGNYERVYGVLGGVVAFMLWVWLSNLAMLFGAVLDTEVERARQLRAGIPAEEQVRLPLRDDRVITVNRTQRLRDVHASAGMRPDTPVDGVTPPAGLRPHG
ncbi:YihY/virulence factor BrkB family protein [Agromyces fucosus]|uniref:YihY/virulence factor BrkB family protein n=1 Tax=Agromyces fucosus TaxID=41985 RepID=A0A4Q2JKR0_9MICO|nr:YihY/virulence factor BrkB family protein [Agromyces fucosus]RXZ47464.1 YihY/virulence factor BrkB family protein [Agromyces fucosus]